MAAPFLKNNPQMNFGLAQTPPNPNYCPVQQIDQFRRPKPPNRQIKPRGFIVAPWLMPLTEMADWRILLFPVSLGRTANCPAELGPNRSKFH